MTIPASLRREVARRAEDRREYCGLSQAGQEAAFHADHVVPVTAGGPTTLENLALACVSCSLRKGARQTSFDPATGDAVPLFHPRRDAWRAHFRWDGGRVVGQTPTGRATLATLDMNRLLVFAIRGEEALRGRQSAAVAHLSGGRRQLRSGIFVVTTRPPKPPSRRGRGTARGP